MSRAIVQCHRQIWISMWIPCFHSFTARVCVWTRAHFNVCVCVYVHMNSVLITVQVLCWVRPCRWPFHYSTHLITGSESVVCTHRSSSKQHSCLDNHITERFVFCLCLTEAKVQTISPTGRSKIKEMSDTNSYKHWKNFSKKKKIPGLRWVCNSISPTCYNWRTVCYVVTASPGIVGFC